MKTFIELDLNEFEEDDDSVHESSAQLIEKEVYDAVSFKPLLVVCCQPVD